MITIYTLAYNEEYMLPFFIEHYRTCFPDCMIVVYDNESTDKTRDIAEASGCEVRTFRTGNTLCDRTYLQIKNSCWKDATTEWVLVCDVDEFCEITTGDLNKNLIAGVNILRFKGFNMVSLQDELQSPFEIKQGIRSESYDKSYCFRRTQIQEINYLVGCHKSVPIASRLVYSRETYTVRHYKYLNLKYMIKRHGEFAKRMNPINIKHNWGGHYLYTPSQITQEFMDAQKNAIVI